MKVMTILGTRPEIIRLALILKKLDKRADHIMVHTGQNHSASLKDIFFDELGLRSPDEYMGAESAAAGEQLGRIMSESHRLLLKHRPDKVLQLGDTNSGLSAIVAEKMGIPVYHMEAGNRCYDSVVPEEKNRRIIDAVSSYCLPYTPGSRDNLIREGVHTQRIMTSGNPILEVLTAYKDQIEASPILKKLTLRSGKYFLVTTHRAENVDNPKHLSEIFSGLDLIGNEYQMPVICSIHPRTKDMMNKYSVAPKNELVKTFDPFGFFDFVKLEKNARCVISDSGTVQEECCLFHVPTVTIRRTTERPETLECGSNILSGLDSDRILSCVKLMIEKPSSWNIPIGYDDLQVSDKVITYLLGNNELTV